MTNFSTPCIASRLVDEIGVGAMLKNINHDDRRAIIIDWVGMSPDCIAVVADAKNYTPDAHDALQMYKIRRINLDKWIALTRGTDELLIE